MFPMIGLGNDHFILYPILILFYFFSLVQLTLYTSPKPSALWLGFEKSSQASNVMQEGISLVTGLLEI